MRTGCYCFWELWDFSGWGEGRRSYICCYSHTLLLHTPVFSFFCASFQQSFPFILNHCSLSHFDIWFGRVTTARGSGRGHEACMERLQDLCLGPWPPEAHFTHPQWLAASRPHSGGCTWYSLDHGLAGRLMKLLFCLLAIYFHLKDATLFSRLSSREKMFSLIYLLNIIILNKFQHSTPIDSSS